MTRKLKIKSNMAKAYIFVFAFIFIYFCFISRDKATIYLRENTLLRRFTDELMKNACEIPTLKKIEDFFEFGKQEKYKCKNLKKVGRGSDGSKYVCFDQPYGIVPNNCIVLSFGINNEWSFDDAMSNLGCTVYSFDPSMGKEDYDRSPTIHFYNLGLSNVKGEAKFPRSQIGKVDTYENILKMLNLTDKKIDYLKMDIEGAEIQFLEDVLSNSVHLLENVNQIGMEIHPLRPPKTDDEESMKKSRIFRLWNFMHHLKCLGFHLLKYDPNTVYINVYTFKNRTVSECYEVVWVKEL